ncbi:MAG: hypothetical protein K2K90_11535 [Lachnospiraceae bacterium]|nr:hypothetical protein [Lachnospiraceae bacterium]
MVKLSLEVVLSPFLKMFLQMIFEFVSDKISPSFGYMTTYVELLVRYAELMKIKVAERFFKFLVHVKFLPFTNSRRERVKNKRFIESL